MFFGITSTIAAAIFLLSSMHFSLLQTHCEVACHCQYNLKVTEGLRRAQKTHIFVTQTFGIFNEFQYGVAKTNTCHAQGPRLYKAWLALWTCISLLTIAHP
jgi:hypothetical protein